MLLIFDLDGTLIDSRLDLANAVNAMRRHMDLGDLEHEVVFQYVGNGALALVQRALGEGFSDDEVAQAHEVFGMLQSLVPEDRRSILSLKADGLSCRDIGEQLGISERTVQRVLEDLRRKTEERDQDRQGTEEL